MYTYTLPGSLPENLVDESTYGVASKDQRLGSAIMFAPFVLIWNLIGFRILYAFVIMCIAIYVYLTVDVLTEKKIISLGMALFSVLNAYCISLTHLNPNIMGMFFVSLLLYLLVMKNPSWFLIGVLYGVLGGVRNLALFFAPALLYRLMTVSKHKKKDACLFFFGAMITIIPILYWKQYAFGNMFMHPSQFSHHEGFRPTFEHRFLFWTFKFNGMFNFPFYTKIIRTPYFVFPTFLTLPLLMVSSLGVFLTACLCRGMWYSFKENKHIALFLLLWFFPMALMFIVQENWSNMKTTFLLLFIHPPILWVAFGIQSLCQAKKKKRVLITLMGFCIVFVLGIKGVGLCDFEVDERWYERFPRATRNEMSFIGDDLRTQRESADMLEKQRSMLARANIFPRVNVPDFAAKNVFEAVRKERKEESLTMVDYWKYIYMEEDQR